MVVFDAAAADAARRTATTPRAAVNLAALAAP